MVFCLSKIVVYVINITARNKLMFTLCNKSIILNTKNSAPEIIKLKTSVIFFDFLYKNFFDNNISHTLDPSNG